MNNLRAAWRLLAGLLTGLLRAAAATSALLLGGVAQAQRAPVALNTPQTVSATISPGMTTVDLPIPLSGVSRLRLDAIVPVEGATFSLIDPTGAFLYVPGDTRVVFNPGRLLPKPLPGGVFETPEMTTPMNGTWRIRLSFPPAPQATVALATVMAVSRYQVGIAIERDVLLVGEDLAVGLLVLDNGVPVAGVTPTLRVSPVGGAAGPAVPAFDNGTGPDGLAGDGVYSIDNTFTAAGTYEIEGTVTIPTPAGPVLRSASQRVRVDSPSIDSAGITLVNQLGAGGCLNAAQVNVNLNVLKAGSYAALVRLRASNGRTLDVRRALTLGVGPASFQAVFSARAIKETLAVDGPWTVQTVDILSVGGTDGSLAFRRRDAGAFNATLAGLCALPIEVVGPLVTTPVLKGGFIGSLDLSVPIRVTTAGSYQISFKLIGAGGADLGLVNASRSLPAGTSNVTVNVATPGYQAADGPYEAISLLVLGAGNSTRLGTLGTTPAYSRWQFAPTITGDLNNDGSVNSADNTLLSGFRNVTALRPGDRRDLNNDGIVDLRDNRELQKRVCTAPSCPVNP
ncbi:choice-of-anchor X domain-containing protein [Rubrivivax sp. RP6-9]|uniref:choice-of-anchor X domain-containing protein n=1 Tax=Rubrivivax sp. RP6-9 TaxID=3415750 RepID=UPI003CC6A01F